jgi:NAD(P)-dependent dehydrogenase (short-subunit alcohol dehydrogenase family)
MRRTKGLDGSVVLVTGAAKGIGAATARELTDRGARVALLDRDAVALAALAGELGDGCVSFVADVTDQASLDAAVHGTVAAFGRIDIVVANAGIAEHGSILVTDSDAFARTVDVNLVGVHRTITAALPQLINSRGYVLIVASVASFLPLPGGGAYSPSKAGAESLAGALRVELAHVRVAVGSAHPCWIDTDMTRAAEDEMPTFRALRGQLPWPARAVTSPEECAKKLADGIERRARRIYVPRAVALVSVLRSALTSKAAERVVLRRAGPAIPQLDREVLAARAARAATTQRSAVGGSR